MSNQYSYRTRQIPSTPRNKRLTDSIQNAGNTGVSSFGISGYIGSLYWTLISALSDGTQLPEGSEYIQTPYSVVSYNDIVAYAENPELPLSIPVSSPLNYGLSKPDGVTIKINSEGEYYVDVNNLDISVGSGSGTGSGISNILPVPAGTGNVVTSLAFDPTTNTLTYQMDGTFALRTELSSYATLESLANYVTLNTEQTITGLKTFSKNVLSYQDVIAYATGEESPTIPVASTTNYGLIKYDGITIKEDENGRIYVASGGDSGVSFTPGIALELTADNKLNVLLGTTSTTACSGNDSRLSDARKNPYSLSWSGYSSGTYDGSATKSITIPSNTNQLTNGAGFIYDANGNFTYLSGSGSASKYLAGNGTFYTISYGELSGTPDLSVYVTLSTAQTISGAKTYTNTGWYNGTGLLKAGPSNNVHIIFGLGSGNCINGVTSAEVVGNLYFNYQSSSAFSRVDSSNNFITTGDVVAYGSSSTSVSIPVASSSSYGIVKYDNSTIKMNSSGQLYAVSSSSGSSGSGSTVAWGTNATYNVALSVDGTSYTLLKSSAVTVGTYSSSAYTQVLTLNGTARTYSLSGHTHSQYLTSHQTIYSLTLKVNGTTYTYTPNSSSQSVTITTSTSSGGGGWLSGTYTDNALVYVKNTGSGGLKFWNTSNFTGVKLGGGNGVTGYNGSESNMGNLYFNYVSGTVNVKIDNSGTITYVSTSQYSDMRLKNKISSIENVLEAIIGIDVFYFNWIYDENKIKHIGVSAQQIQTIFPELVRIIDISDRESECSDYLSVDYSTLGVTVAVLGIKELYSSYKTIENSILSLQSWGKTKDQQIEYLQNRIVEMQAEIDLLKGGEAA